MSCNNRTMDNVGANINTFSGILPRHHNEVGCHNESQKRRGIISDMRKLIVQMGQQPMCEEWDTSSTLNNTRGPFIQGEFPKSQGKPWDLNRVPSRELIGSQMIQTCTCVKRNGLQDDCQRTQCRGRAWCLTEQLPDCPPFTKVPKEWVDADPLQMCPNVPPVDEQNAPIPTAKLYDSKKRVNQP